MEGFLEIDIFLASLGANNVTLYYVYITEYEYLMNEQIICSKQIQIFVFFFFFLSMPGYIWLKLGAHLDWDATKK